jgi:hypothetical protein
MTLRAFLFPESIIGFCMQSGGLLQSVDRNVDIPCGAKLRVEPFQFRFQSIPAAVDDHRREEGYRGTQPGERDAHVMQGGVVASTCRTPSLHSIASAAAATCVRRARWPDGRGVTRKTRLLAHYPGLGCSPMSAALPCCNVCSGVPDASIRAQSTAPTSYPSCSLATSGVASDASPWR